MMCLLKYRRKDRKTGRRERRSKQLLDDRKGTRIYWKLKEETLYPAVETIRIERGLESVVRQTTE
jgi:hypothetical protein